MRPWLASLSLCFVLLSAGGAVAQEESPLRAPVHARGFGMAGAHRATALGAEIVNGNPAGVAAFPRYILELSGSGDFERRFKMGNFALVDNTVGGVGGGYTYSLVSFGEGTEKRTAHLNTIALAGPVSSSILIGASGRHILGRGARRANAITMDAGLLGMFGPARVSLSGHNLIDIRNPDLTRFYAVGLGFVSELLSVSAEVRADWVRDPTRDGPALAYSLGAELFLGDALPLRAGFERDTLTGARNLGLGIGLYAEGSGIDVGYRHELGDGIGRLLSITIRLQLG